ncbi:MAG: thymidine phosphorylase, partial [Nanoarchaeota archaeon]
IAYFVSGVYHNGMSFKETVYLTEAMAKTGRMLKWKSNKIADKHSIGGIPGNRTTPIVVSICAAAGITIPKTSSRAITTAAATADVMEAITNISLSAEELQKVVKKTGACLAWGGSLGLAPADDKLIRVEKMLGVDPESQLIASILSKKLAAGSKIILLDIPYGKGAKVSLVQAKKLKQQFMKMARYFRLNTEVVLTKGDQPIGNAIGPVLEMIDLYKILKREPSRPIDLEEKSIFLAAKLLEMMGKAGKGKGKKRALEILDSGGALKKFEEIIKAQGKKKYALKLAKHKQNILAKSNSKVSAINNKFINSLGRKLGCPTSKGAGIYIHKHIGEKAKKGDLLLTLYSESKKELNDAIKFCNETNPITLRF